MLKNDQVIFYTLLRNKLKQAKVQKNAYGVSCDDAPERWSESIKRGSELSPRSWVIPRILPEGAICILMSEEKAGKSLLCNQVGIEAISHTLSDIYKEKDCTTCEIDFVLVYDVEQDDADNFERYPDLQNIARDDFKRYHKPFPSYEAFVSHITRYVPNDKNSLVVLDNITSIFPSLSNNQVRDFITFNLKPLQEKAMSRGGCITFLILNHMTKHAKGLDKGNSAGAVNWGRLGTCNLALGHSDKGDNYRILRVNNMRVKGGLPEKSEILLVKNDDLYPHFEFVKRIGEETSSAKYYDKIPEKEFMQMLGEYKPKVPGYGIRAIAKKHQYDANVFERALKQYKEEQVANK